MNSIDSEPSVMAPQDEPVEQAQAAEAEAAAPEQTEPEPAAEQAPEDEPQQNEPEPVAQQPVEDAPQQNEPGAQAESEPVAEQPVEDAPQQNEPGAEPPEPTAEQNEPDAQATQELLFEATEPPPAPEDELQRKAVLEAIIYVADEPLSAAQIANALQMPQTDVVRLLAEMIEEYGQTRHGITIREVAGGYKMGTKPEHHEAIRTFVRNLKQPLKLSMAALETLAVIAYKQPITAPEILDIRGVQGGGVLKTLLDRKLITTAGRKNVVGKPILYRTTKEFLIQFGLKDIAELPTLKEFEELRRLALSDDVEPEPPASVDGEVVEEEQG